MTMVLLCLILCPIHGMYCCKKMATKTMFQQRLNEDNAISSLVHIHVVCTTYWGEGELHLLLIAI